MKFASFVLTVALATVAWQYVGAQTLNVSDTGFITAAGTSFVDKNCNEFVFSGANVWQLVEAEAGIDGGSPDDVDTLFKSASSNGINVIRFFPFGILPDFTLQTAPGVYNQKSWDVLDSIISKASKAGVKLIMPFADNWTPVNGKYQYAFDWGEPNTTDPDMFFKSDTVKTVYKNHIQAFVEHINPLTNLAYKDDPTIFAWDLLNEMRSSCNTSAPNASCTPDAQVYVQDWVEEISAFVKSVDSNHMLTTGEEGFYPASSSKSATINPGQKFASQSGQDFIANHAVDDIDFAVSHIWIDNWVVNASYCGVSDNPTCGNEFIENWLESHIEDAQTLNKPFVVEEFGNMMFSNPPNFTARNSIYSLVYNPYLDNLENGGINLKGVAFWQWIFSSGLNISYSDTSYAVETNDSTWTDVIEPTFAPTTAFNSARNKASQCIPGTAKAIVQNSVGPAVSPGADLSPIPSVILPSFNN